VDLSEPGGPLPACEGISPRALAEFVKRPQAAFSNRRYKYAINSHFSEVKGKILSICQTNIVFLSNFLLGCTATIIFRYTR
jgi:hypothetical protein